MVGAVVVAVVAVVGVMGVEFVVLVELVELVVDDSVTVCGIGNDVCSGKGRVEMGRVWGVVVVVVVVAVMMMMGMALLLCGEIVLLEALCIPTPRPWVRHWVTNGTE